MYLSIKFSTEMNIFLGLRSVANSIKFNILYNCQVKEVGVLVKNCACLAEDMAKIWQVYWDLGADGATVPDTWPSDLSTTINMK